MTKTPKELVDRILHKEDTADVEKSPEENEFDVTVVGEDSGGWSRKPPFLYRSMSIALSETTRADEFASISTKYPWNTKGTKKYDELKFVASDDDICEKVLKDISDLSPSIHISTDERFMPFLDNNDRFQALFRDVTTDLMKTTKADNIKFIMDETPLMSAPAGKDIVEDVAAEYGKTVKYSVIKSTKSTLIQTQDFVAGAANRSRTMGSKLINIVEKHITNWKVEK